MYILFFFIHYQEKFWSLDETEQHLAPIFMVQVWDNDKFSFDDFLGKFYSSLQIKGIHFSPLITLCLGSIGMDHAISRRVARLRPGSLGLNIIWA